MKSDVALSLDRAIKWALDAWTKAYCPYSNFRVGAAIITRDGTLFTRFEYGKNRIEIPSSLYRALALPKGGESP